MKSLTNPHFQKAMKYFVFINSPVGIVTARFPNHQYRLLFLISVVHFLPFKIRGADFNQCFLSCFY